MKILDAKTLEEALFACSGSYRYHACICTSGSKETKELAEALKNQNADYYIREHFVPGMENEPRVEIYFEHGVSRRRFQQIRIVSIDNKEDLTDGCCYDEILFTKDAVMSGTMAFNYCTLSNGESFEQIEVGDHKFKLKFLEKQQEKEENIDPLDAFLGTFKII